MTQVLLSCPVLLLVNEKACWFGVFAGCLFGRPGVFLRMDMIAAGNNSSK